MNKRNVVIGLMVSGVIAAGGGGLYRLGLEQGIAQATVAGTSDANTMPESAKTDPSTWGIAEGEAATRRHIKNRLKAGDVDPVTGRMILYYHDPMAPGQRFEAPGKSPTMNMMLVPAYASSEGADAGTVSISPRIRQNLGLRTGEVTAGELAAAVTAVGAIAWNERGQVAVQARAKGFVERLHVRATLDRVVKGQPLFDLYVPDWVAVQEDYLSVRRMQGENLGSLVDAARQRMRQAGMSEAQIALVERTNQLQLRLTLTAPRRGVVTELMAREGSTVMPGMLLARINDLSTVWAHAEVPESQTGILLPGSPVTATTPAYPGKVFRGKVQVLLPEVDTATRTRKARIVLANPNEQLVPGMFVQMRLTAPNTHPALLVPSEALIRTGKRVLAIVLEDDGAFRSVEVQVGIEQDGRSEILNGLARGQRIVLSGQFLIDSEASLRGFETRLRHTPEEHAPRIPASQGTDGNADGSAP